MRTAWTTYPIEVKGGLISNIPPLQQGLNFQGSATSLINMEPSIEGGYKKIYGYTKWTSEKITSSSQIQGVIALSPTDAIAVAGGRYYLSSSKGAWTEKLDSSGAPGGKIRHVTYDFVGIGKVIMVNGTTKPVIYNPSGSTIAIDTLAPSDVEGADYVTEFKNHIFFGNGTNLIFTAPFTDNDYTPGHGAGIINVGSEITGLIVFRQILVIFCNDSIYTLTGSSLLDFVLAPVTRKTGCIDGDTIQEVGGDIMYLGPDGVRFFSATDRNEDFALQRASENIQKDVLDMYGGGNDWSSTVVRSKNQYRIFKWSSSDPPSLARGLLATRFVDQDAVGVSWSRLEGIKPYVIDSKQFGDTEIILFASDVVDESGTDVSYVYQMEFGNSFDGEKIPCYFQTPNLPLTDPRVRKTFYKLTSYIFSEGPTTFEVGLILDGGRSGVIQPQPQIIETNGDPYLGIFGEGIFNTALFSEIVDTVFNLNVVGSSFTVAIYISNDDTGPSFGVDTLLLEYTESDKK